MVGVRCLVSVITKLMNTQNWNHRSQVITVIVPDREVKESLEKFGDSQLKTPRMMKAEPAR